MGKNLILIKDNNHQIRTEITTVQMTDSSIKLLN